MTRPRMQGINDPQRASQSEKELKTSVSAAKRRQEILPLKNQKKMADGEQAIGSNGLRQMNRQRMHPTTNATPANTYITLTLPPG
jgi:hypothetical protein